MIRPSNCSGIWQPWKAIRPAASVPVRRFVLLLNGIPIIGSVDVGDADSGWVAKINRRPIGPRGIKDTQPSRQLFARTSSAASKRPGARGTCLPASRDILVRNMGTLRFISI